MCGICGEFRFDGQAPSERVMNAMLDRLVARGPDGRGLSQHGCVALGSTRLAIIDPKPRSDQPMRDETLKLDMVFNGCIFNYRELRQELEAHGYSFTTESDTEVLLKAHHRWGPVETPRKLRGMFAYAIYDETSRSLTLARDRFGVKPLYVTRDANALRFASTLQALIGAGGVSLDVDREALSHYMTLHSIVPGASTILAGVEKIAPATVRVVSADGAMKDHLYWRLECDGGRSAANRSAADLECELHQHLKDATRAWTVSDVPVGLLLSGGLDSSLLTALLLETRADRLKTYSVGFEPENGEAGDEFFYSDQVAALFATDHTKIVVSSNELLEALPVVIGAMSEPMVSHDCAAFFLLSHVVGREIKVAVSGQGADEAFAGYHWYPKMAASHDAEKTYADAFFDRSAGTLREHLNEEWWSNDPSYALLHREFSDAALTPVDRALRLDIEQMMPDDPVKRVDNMTMACSLEARTPFLDHELVQFAARLPAALKLANGGKGILKETARRYLPAGLIDRPKGYFPVPPLKYLRGPFLELARDALTNASARRRNIFKSAYIERLLAAPNTHITPLGGSELWQCASLELWLQALEPQTS